MKEVKVLDVDSCEVLICICNECDEKFGICAGDLDILNYCPNCGVKVEKINTDE